MLTNLIVLPDGTELTAIKTAKLTESVNSGDEFVLGSAYANILEATLFDVGALLTLTAGDEITLYKVDESGTRTKKGIFILEKPTRPSANMLKLTGYDRVTKLDKDLKTWLDGLDAWPYSLLTFSGMVCEACGLTLVSTDILNADFPVYKPSVSNVTGRQLMKWIGEICCSFCQANSDGNIEFSWYTPSGVTIAATGDRYYYQGALSYETYDVTPIEAVQIRLADSESGALWPEAEEGANSYIITGNGILNARVTSDLIPYLKEIEDRLSGVSYTPCKLSVPACLDVSAGSIVNITDKNGKTITAYVMTKTTSGQRDTIQCDGSYRRDSTISVNNTPATAQDILDKLTQMQVFNKLTNNGELQGLFFKDGELYINAEYIKAGTLRADEIRLLPDGVSRYLFESWDELNAFIEDTATNMPYHTQKVFGVILDLEGTTYAMLSIAKGYDGDGEPSIVTTLTTGQTTMYRCGYAEGYDPDTGAVEEWSWYDWQGNLSGSDNDVVNETTIDGWRVREWSNGECELWATIEATANLLSWGNVYYAEDVIAQQAYPVTFASAPTVTATPKTASEYCYGLLSGTQEGTVAASPSFSIWRANAASASIPVRVDLYVKGTLG